MSVTSVDFPEPDTPVTAMNSPRGSSTVRFCRLWSRAPTTRSTRSGSGTRRRGGAPQCQVFESHVLQEAQPVGHFLQDRLRDAGVEPAAPGGAQRDALEERERVADREIHDVADPLPVHQNREALGLEALAAARGAGLLHHELFELFAHAVGRGLPVAALDVLEDAIPPRLVLAVPLIAVIMERARTARGTAQEHLARGCGEGLPRRVQVELECAREAREHDFAEVPHGLAPRQDDTLENREDRVSQHQVGVYLPPSPGPGAFGARADRRVGVAITRHVLLQLRSVWW